MKIKTDISERKKQAIRLHRKYRDTYDSVMRRRVDPVEVEQVVDIRESHIWKFIPPVLNFTTIMAVYLALRLGNII